RAATRAAHLRPAVLGHGLPARDVHAEHGPSLPGARPPLAAGDPARVLLVRTGGVDGDVRWSPPATVRSLMALSQRGRRPAGAARRIAVAISSLRRPTAALMAVTTDPVDPSRGASTILDSWLERTSFSPGRLIPQRAFSVTRPLSSASKRRIWIGI